MVYLKDVPKNVQQSWPYDLNNPESKKSGVELFGALKSAYDIGKTIAPYAVRIGAALL